jgi:cytochrome c-type biogenesis protein
VPGYLSFVSGASIVRKPVATATAAQAQLLIPSGASGGAAIASQTLVAEGSDEYEAASVGRVASRILTFIAGFTLAFIVLFGLYDALSAIFGNFKPFVQVLAGILVIIFGLHFMGVFRLPFLNMERRFALNNKPAGYIGAFGLGFAFAFGWSPCVGPLLTAAITQASNDGRGTLSASILPGIALMVVYSAGLGVPFLLAGLFVNRFLKFMARIRRHFQVIEIASGLLLIIVGFLIITGNLSALAVQFNQVRF